ncbi:MAG: hypothetical protein KDB82_06685 [Planctomycetes bacterium]|nr:hypothetical protein [Planctomycetota bacterium]
MAEFDQSRDGPSPEVQLIARMRLQRVVFGAFAIVLVCLFALGLSAYRRMQGEKKDAQNQAVNADAMAKAAEKSSDRIERELQNVAGELGDTRRALALEKCRLAMHEVRDGQLARARALLEEAQRLGPPAWAPLLSRLTQDQAVRFNGSEHADSPVLCGAMSLDRSHMAVLRDTGEFMLIETYDAAGGQLLRTETLDGVARLPDDARPRLLLNRDGSAWYLSAGGLSYYASAGRVVEVGERPDDYDPVLDEVRSVDADAGLSVVYEACGRRGLIRRTRMTDGNWLSERVPLDLEAPNVLAACLAGDSPVVITPSGIYKVGKDGKTGLLHPLEAAPEYCALKWGAGAALVALLNGRSLELLSIKVEDTPHVVTCRHEMPDEETQDLCFLSDDTPVWIGRSGRIVSMNFSTRESKLLGGYTLSFVERHPQGWVFGNRKGEVSVRTEESFRLLGEPQHLLPPQFVAEPRAHGFILRAPGATLYVLQNAEVRGLGHVLNVALAPQGPAWIEGGDLHLPNGSLSREDGTLIGAFSDGSVLLYAQPQKLKHVDASSVREFLLQGGGRAPDPVVLATEADVAALRLGGDIFVCDLVSDPQPVAGRAEVEPNLMALDALGEHLAIAYGPTIVVHQLRSDSVATVRTTVAPKQIALLFGGSVLVSLEAGEMVLYEVSTGRELLRAGDDVTALCASGEGSLRLIAGARLVELQLQTDE